MDHYQYLDPGQYQLPLSLLGDTANVEGGISHRTPVGERRRPGGEMSALPTSPLQDDPEYLQDVSWPIFGDLQLPHSFSNDAAWYSEPSTEGYNSPTIVASDLQVPEVFLPPDPRSSNLSLPEYYVPPRELSNEPGEVPPGSGDPKTERRREQNRNAQRRHRERRHLTYCMTREKVIELQSALGTALAQQRSTEEENSKLRSQLECMEAEIVRLRNHRRSSGNRTSRLPSPTTTATAGNEHFQDMPSKFDVLSL